jgi:hypothetical protein
MAPDTTNSIGEQNASAPKFKYPDRDSVLAEIASRQCLGSPSDATTLLRALSLGGDNALYRAAAKFGVELPKRAQQHSQVSLAEDKTELAARYILPFYPTPESVADALRIRESHGLDNYPEALRCPQKAGGDKKLFDAARYHSVPLPKPKKLYVTPEEISRELERRAASGLNNNPRSLSLLKESGGDSTLMKAAKKAGLALPRVSRKVRFPDITSVKAALEERTRRGLSNRAKDLQKSQSEGGDVSLYHVATSYGLLSGRRPARYPNADAVVAALARRAAAGRGNTHFDLFKTANLGGDYALYFSATRHNVPLPVKQRPRRFSDVESINAELASRAARGLANHAVALIRPKKDGGDIILYNATRDYAVRLPRKPHKYPDAASVIAALAKRVECKKKNDHPSLFTTSARGGDFSLYLAAVKFKVPLPRRGIVSSECTSLTLDSQGCLSIKTLSGYRYYNFNSLEALKVEWADQQVHLTWERDEISQFAVTLPSGRRVSVKASSVAQTSAMPARSAKQYVSGRLGDEVVSTVISNDSSPSEQAELGDHSAFLQEIILGYCKDSPVESYFEFLVSLYESKDLIGLSPMEKIEIVVNESGLTYDDAVGFLRYLRNDARAQERLSIADVFHEFDAIFNGEELS